MKTGPAFSSETIDSEPIPQISKDLLPWILKDRKEAVEGAYVKDSKGKIVHDGQGLDKARQGLRQAQAAKQEKITDPEIKDFLDEQESIYKSKVEFYLGKIYLLDKIIEKSK